MALSANSSRTFRHTNVQRFKVGVSQTIYKGAAVGVKESDGLAYEYTPASGTQFVGFASKKVVSDASGYLSKEGVPSGYDNSNDTPYIDVIAPDQILDNQSVTGVSAQTDMFAPVWMTDDDTFTLTPNSAGAPVGYVLQVRSTSGAKADVAIFNFSEMGQHLLTDGGFRRDGGAAQLQGAVATALTYLIKSIPLRGAGYATKLVVVVGRKSSGHTGDLKLQILLNGTNLKFSTTNKFTITDTSLKVNGAVITRAIAASANNKFADGEYLAIKGSIPTTPTAGLLNVYVESVRRLA